jgi:hypothetical protein
VSSSTGPGFRIDLSDKDDIRFAVGDLPDVLSPLKKRIEHFNALPRTGKVAQVTAGIFRYGPYAMFALLPAFALLLKVLYLGRRNRYPGRPQLYGEHLTFAAHNHAFAALAIVGILATKDVIRAAIIVWLLVYPLLSLRAVYCGSWPGVLARAFVMVVAYAVLFTLATGGLLITAIVLG